MKVARILKIVAKATIAPVLFDVIYSWHVGRPTVQFAPFIFPFALIAVVYEDWWSKRRSSVTAKQ
jgi:cellobiose-specific phosphotransferase system component IIC